MEVAVAINDPVSAIKSFTHNCIDSHVKRYQGRNVTLTNFRFNRELLGWIVLDLYAVAFYFAWKSLLMFSDTRPILIGFHEFWPSSNFALSQRRRYRFILPIWSSSPSVDEWRKSDHNSLNSVEIQLFRRGWSILDVLVHISKHSSQNLANNRKQLTPWMFLQFLLSLFLCADTSAFPCGRNSVWLPDEN